MTLFIAIFSRFTLHFHSIQKSFYDKMSWLSVYEHHVIIFNLFLIYVIAASLPALLIFLNFNNACKRRSSWWRMGMGCGLRNSTYKCESKFFFLFLLISIFSTFYFVISDNTFDNLIIYYHNIGSSHKLCLNNFW